MSAFDELERQLLRSVARRTARSPIASRGRRWLHPARGRRGLLLVVIPLVFAAAAAATIATHSGETSGELFNRVLLATRPGDANSGPCRTAAGPGRATLSDEAPGPQIIAVLPELASAPAHPPSAAVVQLAEHDSGGSVLARTIREVPAGGGVTLILFVSHGQGPFTAVDPHACLAARLAALAKLRPNANDAARRQVARQLAVQPDTDPRVQSLSLFHEEHGRVGGGSSVPLPTGSRPLPTGVMFYGYSCHHGCSPTLYGGIVGPHTAYLTLAPASHANARRARAVRRRIPVIQGLFAFKLARGVGRETLVQRAADGRALLTRALPENGPMGRSRAPAAVGPRVPG